MQDQGFEDILASMQQIVRRAYDLGRSEALKQVVEVLKADAPAAKTLALPSPDHDATLAMAAPIAETAAFTSDPAPASPTEVADGEFGRTAAGADAAPWYARPPRRKR